MPRKVKIILNPMADMGNAWRVARDLRSITEQHGSVDWSGTVYPGMRSSWPGRPAKKAMTWSLPWEGMEQSMK